jgi:dTDP-4-dehydrorhamnose 3,5-epimerase
MALEVINTPLDGLILIKPKVYYDNRGYFFESYNREQWEETGIDVDFVQDNQSLSNKNALRGLHFQRPPYSQAKLVRVVQGSALDVMVDLRKNSPTYGKHFAVELSGKNHYQLFIPEGFAHGFLTLEDNTIFVYKCSNYYNAASEDGLMWNDPQLNIDWGIGLPIISAKDQHYKPFQEFLSPF